MAEIEMRDMNREREEEEDEEGEEDTNLDDIDDDNDDLTDPLDTDDTGGQAGVSKADLITDNTYVETPVTTPMQAKRMGTFGLRRVFEEITGKPLRKMDNPKLFENTEIIIREKTGFARVEYKGKKVFYKRGREGIWRTYEPYTMSDNPITSEVEIGNKNYIESFAKNIEDEAGVVLENDISRDVRKNIDSNLKDVIEESFDSIPELSNEENEAMSESYLSDLKDKLTSLKTSEEEAKRGYREKFAEHQRVGRMGASDVVRNEKKKELDEAKKKLDKVEEKVKDMTSRVENQKELIKKLKLRIQAKEHEKIIKEWGNREEELKDSIEDDNTELAKALSDVSVAGKIYERDLNVLNGEKENEYHNAKVMYEQGIERGEDPQVLTQLLVREESIIKLKYERREEDLGKEVEEKNEIVKEITERIRKQTGILTRLNEAKTYVDKNGEGSSLRKEEDFTGGRGEGGVLGDVLDAVDKLKETIGREEMSKEDGDKIIETKIKSLKVVEDRYNKLASEAEGAKKHEYEAFAKIAKLEAERIRVEFDIKTEDEDTMNMIKEEVENNPRVRYEKFKDWLKKNGIALTGVLLSAGGIIAAIIASLRGTIRNVAHNTSKLGRALKDWAKKLWGTFGPIIKALGNILFAILSWLAKFMMWVGNNLWFVFVVIAVALAGWIERKVRK